jgi:type IV pilus assembly protein PilA
MNKILGPRMAFSARAQRAFTLVELLAVIAILSILVAVALPAYNNYTLKSKFTEVVLATAPTKTAISACAVSGDCVSAGAVSLVGQPGTASPADVYPGTSSTKTLSPSQMYAAVYATWTDLGYSQSVTATAAHNLAQSAASGTPYYLIAGGGGVCIANTNGVGFNQCTYAATTAAHIQAILNSGSDPYYVSTPATLASLPCVGASTGCSPASKYVQSVSYDTNGVVYGTAVTSSGLNGETFVLTPAYSSGRIDWAASGSCKTRSGGALC